MRSTVILCDWAEAVAGKLYVQGAGWNKILAGVPATFAVAAIIRVDYNETNMSMHAVLSLVDEDGRPFPVDDALRAEFDFEVGRPPGMRPGQYQNLPFAIKINGLTFPEGGYEFQLHIGQHRQDVAIFSAVPAL